MKAIYIMLLFIFNSKEEMEYFKEIHVRRILTISSDLPVKVMKG